MKQSLVSRKDNFRFMLIMGTVLINMFVYLMVGAFLYNSRQHYDHLAKVTTQNMAKSLETNFSGIFDKIDVGLSSVVRETERQLTAGKVNKDALESYMKKHLQDLPELDGLVVSDDSGNLLYGSDALFANGPNVSDRDYFLQLRNNPNLKLAVSSLLQGRITGKWRIALAKRINHQDGSFAGVAIGIFGVEYFDKLFSKLNIGKSGAIGVRDSEFRLVALQPKGREPASQIGSNVISQKTRDMIQANPVTATYKTVFARDHKERMVTFQKAARYPYYIFATIAPSDYALPWRKEAAVGLVLLAIFTLATVISGRMVFKSRVHALLHAEAKRFGEEMKLQNDELNAALSRIKRLEGIISICSCCKKIRNEQQSWEQLENYLTVHSDAMFSHGLCPDCAEQQMKSFNKTKIS